MLNNNNLYENIRRVIEKKISYRLLPFASTITATGVRFVPDQYLNIIRDL